VPVDAYASLLRVRNSEAKAGRLVATLSLSSATTGVVAYYATAVVEKLVPSDLSIALTILIFGVVSGAAAGYLAARIWNGNLRSRFQGWQHPGGDGQGDRTRLNTMTG